MTPDPRTDAIPDPAADCTAAPVKLADPAAAAKAAARKAARARRAALTLDRAAAALALAQRFLAAFPPPLPGVVAFYHPIADEIDVMPLLARLDALGVVCALPVCVARGRALLFRRWRPGQPLAPDALGLAAPIVDEAAGAVRPDMVLVPLLSFDRRGGRLGYGGGFYDRTLEALRTLGAGVIAVGVGFAEQEVDNVPLGAHDQRLDWIVTDRWAAPTVA